MENCLLTNGANCNLGGFGAFAGFLVFVPEHYVTMFINTRGRGGWIIYNEYLIRLGPLNGLQFSLFPHYNTLYYSSTLHFYTL
jgi:hypothetical protein